MAHEITYGDKVLSEGRWWKVTLVRRWNLQDKTYGVTTHRETWCEPMNKPAGIPLPVSESCVQLGISGAPDRIATPMYKWDDVVNVIRGKEEGYKEV